MTAASDLQGLAVEGRPPRLAPRDGGTDGTVLSLTLGGDGFYDAFYTVDANVGTPSNKFPLLVDTGSADSWVTSPQCNCAPNSYSGSSSSSATSLASSWQASYLQGSVQGSLWSDSISLGPYTLQKQALCSADQIHDERTSMGFSGLLGLGMPAISGIRTTMRAQGGGGEPVLTNLWNGNVVTGGVPAKNWFSVVIDRPGFKKEETNGNSTIKWSHVWPARLGVGAHVDEVAQAFSSLSPGSNDPTSSPLDNALTYVDLVSFPTGFTHWNSLLTEVAIYSPSGDGISGTAQYPRLSSGIPGKAFPVAVLDTGGSTVVASRVIADAIYSALGVSMSADGRYYVKCNQPLNITITLGTAAPIPIHPLDMSTYVGNDANANPTDCLGTIQASDQLGTSTSVADIVMGISILRNMYVVHQINTPTTTVAADPLASPTPRMGIARLTNPTLALTEFHNVRVLGLTPGGEDATTRVQMSGSSSESLSVLGKIFIGVGAFAAVVVIVFAARWIVLRRRFKRLQKEGKLAGNMGYSESGALGDFAEMVRRKTTIRSKALRRQRDRAKAALGGWRDASEPDHDEGISGAPASKSALGHGSMRVKRPGSPVPPVPPVPPLPATNLPRSANADLIPPQRIQLDDFGTRPGQERQGSGPFAGFSLWTFVGGKRLLGPRHGKPGYQRTASGEYEMQDTPAAPRNSGLLSEDELRRQRFEAYKLRQKRENEGSVWSDVTWIERPDGTFVPAGANEGETTEFGGRKGYAYPGTPNETLIGGSTTNLNSGKRKEYGFPKDGGSDDDSTEKGSTLHGSPPAWAKSATLGPPPMAHASSGGSGEALPLLSSTAMASGSQSHSHPRSRSGSGSALPPGAGIGHATHRPTPSLELNHGRPLREDSSGIVTASPYPMTPGEDPFLPGGTGTMPSTSSTGAGTDPFNPFVIPSTIPAPQQPVMPLVHPARGRVALAMEPSLSPLTEVNSSEFPPSSNRASILSSLAAAGAPGAEADEARRRAELERQSSIGALSMQSDVLVPLPISLMELGLIPRPSTSPPPMEYDRRPPAQPTPSYTAPPPTKVSGVIPGTGRSFDVPSRASRAAVQPSHSLPAQTTTLPSSHPPAMKANVAPPASSSRSRNPFDLLGFNDFELGVGSNDSRFPSVRGSSQDSRFPNVATESSKATTRPVIDLDQRRDGAAPRPAPVAIGQGSNRPQLRTRMSDVELARSDPRANHIVPSADDSVLGREQATATWQQQWVKPRSQSSGAAGLQQMDRAPARIPQNALEMPTGADDFSPAHQYRPSQPEQQTMPNIGQTSPQTSPGAHSANTTSTVASSTGMRNRGPRPMGSAPRLSASGSDSSRSVTASSPPAISRNVSAQAILQSRQGTTYDSPVTLPSATSSSPPSLPLHTGAGSISSAASSSRPIISSSSSGSGSGFSLPPGAKAPTPPGSTILPAPQAPPRPSLPQLPRARSSTSVNTLSTNPPPVVGTPPEMMTDRSREIRRMESTVSSYSNNPEAAYGGMTNDTDNWVEGASWRNDAASTAGVAGRGARSRFTDNAHAKPDFRGS